LADGGPVPVGVKLGSTRTVIAYPTGEGLRVIRTLTCLAAYEEPLTGKTQYRFGDDAAAEYPDRIEFVLRSGLPEEEDRLNRVTRFFEAVVDSHDVPSNSVVVYATPAVEDTAGFRNLRAVIERSPIGSHAIEGYPEALCGSIPALGAGLEAVEETFLTLNLAATSLELMAYRQGEQLSPTRSGAVTANEIDRDIITNVENETQGRVHLDINSAREYKEQHADFENFEPFTDVIQQPGGGSHEFTIEWSVMDAVDAYLDRVVDIFVTEVIDRERGDHLEVGRHVVVGPEQVQARVDRLDECRHPVPGYLLSVHLDLLPEIVQCRRGEQADIEARRAEDALEHLGGASLAVRSCNLDDIDTGLRCPEMGQHPCCRLDPQFWPVALEGLQVLGGVVILHTVTGPSLAD